MVTTFCNKKKERRKSNLHVVEFLDGSEQVCVGQTPAAVVLGTTVSAPDTSTKKCSIVSPGYKQFQKEGQIRSTTSSWRVGSFQVRSGWCRLGNY